MASDAIIVGEEWISEHYFNTDATKQSFRAKVLERRKTWDEEHDGGNRSTRDRFTAVRGGLAATFAGLAEVPSVDELRTRVTRPLRDALGFTDGSFRLAEHGPLTAVAIADLDEPAPLALIEAVAVESLEDLLQKDTATLIEPFVPDHDANHPVVSVSRLLSRIFADDDGPAFALVFAGRWLLLAERERWPEGRYLAIDLQLVVDRNETAKGGEIDRTLACVSAGSLLPDAEGVTWWRAVLDESIKHTVGVSKDLREGVRASIEIIANEVVARRAAQGREPLPASQAQPLAKQALRYLYRILFLLYAEASPELKVLPVGASEYEEGYSLDRLRELVLVELSTASEDRTHLYGSLDTLFRLVDIGHGVPVVASRESASDDSSAAQFIDDAPTGTRPEGLTFNSLKADLFHPDAIALIDEVKLGDAKLQEVLAHLLLSKEQRGKDRGFISYGDLGINQLGAVYEGLMSYTGFFAETDLYEVAKEGDSSKGSWVVPVDRSDSIAAKDFVQTTNPFTGESHAVLHAQGSFVFRLAGRERQQSASYYTPEVLTRFVVSQALEELLDQNGETTKAEDILTLTVCEPALGSGAFAIEAVRQLAEEYLSRREKELGERVDPDLRPRELAKVKASIALHQVYGVDLNATAVELAEISLWLDTMVEGLAAPWFGLHLRRGNSLIGARRAVYSRAQAEGKGRLTDVPRDVPLAELAGNMREGRVAEETAGAIHHFLLPSAGWGSAVEFKEVSNAKELFPESVATLATWRRRVTSKPTKKQLDLLANLSYRVESLWQIALRRLEIAEREARRSVALWGSENSKPTSDGSAKMPPDVENRPVPREEIEAKLQDPEGAYQRLRRVMDAWNALWFWPITDSITEGAAPPELDEWIAGLTAILGTHFEGKSTGKSAGGETLGMPSGWKSLGDAEELELAFAGAQSVSDLLESTPWLRVAERIAEQQGFFHWSLDFAMVFARGGFDLQVGNPPWVRPRTDVSALLAEGDPWWQLSLKPSQAQIAVKQAEGLRDPNIAALVIDATASISATIEYLGSAVNFPVLDGLQPDLYRCFMAQAWRNSNEHGISSLIHPETHFTDEKAGALRGATYGRLRRHWQFANSLQLFEIDSHVLYGVHVYGSHLDQPSFVMATSLYHPDTAERSMVHDGTGVEPALKDDAGNWDVRPHRDRVSKVDITTLGSWHALLENEGVPLLHTRMVYAVNRSTASVLDKLANQPRIGELDLAFSRGWDESRDRRNGTFEMTWGEPETWDDVILQGPHIFVATPFYKAPNESMRSNGDWSVVDLEALGESAIPTTSYKPASDKVAFDAAYTHWGDERLPARDHYRVAWRSMAANTGERTLIPAIIPPGTSHVLTVYSFALPRQSSSEGLPLLVSAAAAMSSLIADFAVRVVPRSNIINSTIARLPIGPSEAIDRMIRLRFLRLNSLTSAFSDLWAQSYLTSFLDDGWAGGFSYPDRPDLGDVPKEWNDRLPLRRSVDRRQALLEIDALVALSLGITADELCMVYRTQFAVLRNYDRNAYLYDANGRLISKEVLKAWRSKGGRISVEERTAINASGNAYLYELPFVTFDRETGMRQAYAHFEQILGERS